MSADIHTSAPARGVSGIGGGNGSRASQQVAVLTDDFGTPLIPAPGTPHTEPISWSRDSSDAIGVERRQPRLRQLVGVCGWAALLGVVGLVVGIRGFIGDLVGAAPGWYEPAMIGVGLVGIGLTVCAFVTVHRRRMPYALLGAATLVLIYAVILTALAF